MNGRRYGCGSSLPLSASSSVCVPGDHAAQVTGHVAVERVACGPEGEQRLLARRQERKRP